MQPIINLLMDYSYGTLVIKRNDKEESIKIKKIYLTPNAIEVYGENNMITIPFSNIVNYNIIAMAEDDSEEMHGEFSLVTIAMGEDDLEGFSLKEITVEYRFCIMPFVMENYTLKKEND